MNNLQHITWENNKNVGFPLKWLLDAFFPLTSIMILNNSPLSAFSISRRIYNHVCLSVTLKGSMHMWPTLLATLAATLKRLWYLIFLKNVCSVPQNLLCWDRHLCIPILPSVSSYIVMWTLLKEKGKLSVGIFLTYATNIN